MILITSIDRPGYWQQCIVLLKILTSCSTDEVMGWADYFACQPHTFSDWKKTFAKIATTGCEMTPNHLMPLLASGTGSTRNFTEIQRQQRLLFETSTGAGDGMPIIFMPICDFMNQQQKIFRNANKLTFQLDIDTYGNAVTDVCTSSNRYFSRNLDMLQWQHQIVLHLNYMIFNYI